MALFDFFRKKDFDGAVAEFRETPGAWLLDVRSPQEYREGHVPGSVNLPLPGIEDVSDLIKDPAAPVYVYCRSGARSARAVSTLREMGYINTKDIGGIIAWHGPVER